MSQRARLVEIHLLAEVVEALAAAQELRLQRHRLLLQSLALLVHDDEVLTELPLR